MTWLLVIGGILIAGLVAIFYKYYNPPMSSEDNLTDIPLAVPESAPNQPIQPSTVPTPTPIAPKATYANFCLSIRDFEGKPGDRNYKNNNPGNCRYSPVGYLPMYEPVGKDKDGFAIFKDYATGFLYLENMIKVKVHLHPEQSILDFMKIYAPASDGNSPVNYSIFIARRLGVDKETFLMKDLV